MGEEEGRNEERQRPPLFSPFRGRSVSFSARILTYNTPFPLSLPSILSSSFPFLSFPFLPPPSLFRLSRHLALTPSLLSLLLALASSSPSSRDASLGCVRDMVVEEAAHRVEIASAPWLSAVAAGTATDGPLTTLTSILTFLSFAKASSNDSFLWSLSELGFMLVDVVPRDACSSKNRDPPHYAAAASVGRTVLAAVFDASSAAASSVVKTVTARATGRGPNAVEHAKLLLEIARVSPDALAEHTPSIVGWLGHLPTGGLPPAAVPSVLVPVLSLLLPRSRSSLDQAFLFTKKALFCPAVDRRCAGASLLVLLATVGGADEEVLG